MHPSTEQVRVMVRRAPFEEGAERLEALVVLPFVQGDFGQAAPRREEIRSLLGHLCKDSPPLLGFAGGKVKVSQLEPRQRADWRELGGGPILAFGLTGVAFQKVEVP